MNTAWAEEAILGGRGKLEAGDIWGGGGGWHSGTEALTSGDLENIHLP